MLLFMLKLIVVLVANIFKNKEGVPKMLATIILIHVVVLKGVSLYTQSIYLKLNLYMYTI